MSEQHLNVQTEPVEDLPILIAKLERMKVRELVDPLTSAAILRSVRKQLSQWRGRIYEKLSANLTNWADGLFAYHAGLSQALQILTNRWGQKPSKLCRVSGKSKLTRNAILNR